MAYQVGIVVFVLVAGIIYQFVETERVDVDNGKNEPLDLFLESFHKSLYPGIPPTIRFLNPSWAKIERHVAEKFQLNLNWGKLETKTFASSYYYNKILDASLPFRQNSTWNWIGRIGVRACTSTKQPYVKNPVLTKYFQKYNHIPGMMILGNKVTQWKLLRKFMRAYGQEDFPFAIPTYILPQECAEFAKYLKQNNCSNETWIVKPAKNSLSKGIYLINDSTQIKIETLNSGGAIVQKFVQNPFLVNGKKVEFRVYVLVTSVSPLRIFASFNSDARFGLVKYPGNPIANLTNPCGLIFAPNIFTELCFVENWTDLLGHTETVLKSHFSSKQRTKIKSDMEDAIIKILISAQPILQEKSRLILFNSYNAFHLLAFDFMLDQNLHVWFNEINTKPILFYLPNFPDPYSIGTDVLNIVGYNLSPLFVKILSREINQTIPLALAFNKNLHKFELNKQERKKISKFAFGANTTKNSASILTKLTPNDVRQLVASTDELNRCSRQTNYSQIYPAKGMKKYEKYLKSKTQIYYSRLNDAWISKYQSGTVILKAGIRHISSSLAVNKKKLGLTGFAKISCTGNLIKTKHDKY